jgi:hypothetical protein
VASMDNGPSGAGIGLRLPHLTDVTATRPAAAWFETIGDAASDALDADRALISDVRSCALSTSPTMIAPANREDRA